MTGFLTTQTAAAQVEALYIAYFDRAGDNQGQAYWVAQANAGLSTVQIAQSFAVQPEAAALHVPTDHTNGAAVDAFIQATYANLFSRAADTGGLAYWHTQITTGAVSLGAAVVAIANGATGNDQAVLGAKIASAIWFTTNTYSANEGTYVPLDPSFLTAAHTAVAAVVDAASAAATDHTLQLHYIDYGSPAILVGQAQVTDMAHAGA